MVKSIFRGALAALVIFLVFSCSNPTATSVGSDVAQRDVSTFTANLSVSVQGGQNVFSAVVYPPSGFPTSLNLYYNLVQSDGSYSQVFGPASVNSSGYYTYSFSLPVGQLTAGMYSAIVRPSPTSGTLVTTNSVNVIALKAPTFTYAPASVLLGVSNSFNVSSVPGATSYEWTPGGIGGTSKLITLSAAGSQTVSVRAVNGIYSGPWVTRSVFVYALPTPVYTRTISSLKQYSTDGVAVSPVSGADSYEWTVTPSSGVYLYHGAGSSGYGCGISANATGTYTLKVRAVNSLGVSDWASTTFTVYSGY